MGEKGNEVDHGLVAAVAGATEPSLVERVTTTTTQTVVGVGQDLAATLKDKAIDHGADAVIDEARTRLHRDRTDGPSTDDDAASRG